jgi:hypothetical protein
MICEDSIPLNDLGITKDQIVILSVSGSNMYGTANENSDEDYLGVFMPTKDDILMNRVKKQIHLPKESGLDLQMWSIYYFLKLALQGETMAIDLLHSPRECWVYHSDLWNVFSDNRRMFYTKQMKSFVGYARKQAAKYGVKGNRISSLQQVIDFLKSACDIDDSQRLKSLWNHLPKPEHVHLLEDAAPSLNDEKPIRMYQVCGKKFQETVTVRYILDRLELELAEYGKRAMKAANNEGIDWKAFSHAIRAANQVYDILIEGEYKFPLKDAAFIKKVKEGKIPYEIAESLLNDYIDHIERLMKISNLPETSAEAKCHFENGIKNYIERHVL